MRWRLAHNAGVGLGRGVDVGRGVGGGIVGVGATVGVAVGVIVAVGLRPDNHRGSYSSNSLLLMFRGLLPSMFLIQICLFPAGPS